LDSFFERNAYDAKKTWQQINLVLGKRPKNSEEIQMLLDNGIGITDKKSIADALNHQYINISKSIQTNNINRNSILDYHKNKNCNIQVQFECPECTEDEIKFLILKLKSSNSKDIFGISNNFLKLHCDELTPIITKIVNKHLFEGTFPDALKFSIVKPLYKQKGSKTDKKNYRPISLISILSKVFEGVIYRRIFEHCKNNEYFHPNQFGYQEKSCPESAMLHSLNDIYNLKNEGFLTALLTIDLTSAFDCLDHEILLIKLSKLKFPPFFMRLLESFLSFRSQSVRVDDTLSERLFVFCGSPQGGVLSGLIFNIYVNPIFELPLISYIRLYCDDISLIASGNDYKDLKLVLESDLELINKWLLYHCLKANCTKTNYVIFSGKKKFESFTEPSLDVKFGNEVVERVESVKIVGLNVDETLNFHVQIEQIKNKIIPFVAKLGKIRRFISEKTALKLYFAHVYSNLLFMNSIWSTAPKYLTESIAVIQRRALRIVFRKDRRCHNVELYSEKVLPFSAICEYHQNLILFKIKHRLFKNHVSLPVLSDQHQHYTRNRDNFREPSARLSITENNFYYRATRTFNKLPEKVKKFHNITSFKNRLKEHLYEKSIEESDS
jgi:hypothetical protein